MKRDLYVKKGNTAIPTGVSTGDAILQTADAQTVAQLQQAVATLQTSVSALQADLAVEKAKGKGPNTEVWITESGTYTVPVTGEYEATLISGGNGAFLDSSRAWGGDSGNTRTYFIHLTAGAEIPVTIGAGGIGAYNPSGTLQESDMTASSGGITHFGDFSSAPLLTEPGSFTRFRGNRVDKVHGSEIYAIGGGSGVLQLPSETEAEGKNLFRFFGAGGSAGYGYGSENAMAASGRAGGIRLRYYDPNKSTTPDTDQEETSPQNPSDGA